jgi:hypothetical protein
VNRPIGIALTTAFGILTLLFAGAGLLLAHDEAAARTVQNGTAGHAQELARPAVVSDQPAVAAVHQASRDRGRTPFVRTLASGALLLAAVAALAIIALGSLVLRQPSREWTGSARNPEAPSVGAGWGA